MVYNPPTTTFNIASWILVIVPKVWTLLHSLLILCFFLLMDNLMHPILDSQNLCHIRPSTCFGMFTYHFILCVQHRQKWSRLTREQSSLPSVLTPTCSFQATLSFSISSGWSCPITDNLDIHTSHVSTFSLFSGTYLPSRKAPFAIYPILRFHGQGMPCTHGWIRHPFPLPCQARPCTHGCIRHEIWI